MVAFMSESEPTIEEQHNQVSKSQTLKDSLDSFDRKLIDFSFEESFIDFDSIKEFFEDSNPEPDRYSLENSGLFGSFEKRMEVGFKESSVGTHGMDSIVDGCNQVLEESKPIVDGPIEKVKFETEGDFDCSIEEMGKASLVNDSNPVNGDGMVAESEKVSNEVMGRVSLVSGLSSVIPDWSVVKSVVVSDEMETGDVCLAAGLSSVIGNDVGCMNCKAMSDEDESESASESETECSSSLNSSSSSSSSSDDEEEEEIDEEQGTKEKKKIRVQVNRDGYELGKIEEGGEIRDVDGEEMVDGIDDDDNDKNEEEEEADRIVDWSDVDEEHIGAMSGPIRSKNELKVLPLVPPVDVTLQPHHRMLPVGVILSIIGAQVIVEGMEKHNPLNEGSVLWVTEKRCPLGLVDEIFGPVKNPYYVVRYNSEGEVPAGIHEGTLISFVPEFANHVLSENLFKKGYDASGANDEEVSDDEEFSDDEKEAEHKRMLKMSKRGMNDEQVRNKKDGRKKVQNRDGNCKRAEPSGQQTMITVDQLPPNQNQHNVSPVGPSMSVTSVGNCSSFSALGQGFPSGTGFVTTFPSITQTAGVFLPSNGVWANGVPRQQPLGAVIPGGLPVNSMPLAAQNQLQHPYQMPIPNVMPLPTQDQMQHPYQMPIPNGMPFQQQFNASQGSLSNTVLPGGQLNSFTGPTCPPWPGIVGQNCLNQTVFGMSFQAQPTHPTMNSINMADPGMLCNGLSVELNSNLQLSTIVPGNIQAPQQFNAGASPSDGRKHYQRRGGRFASWRGHQPTK